MRNIALFVEDYAHRQIIGSLVQRLADEAEVAVQLHWYSAVGGHSRVAAEVKRYLRELKYQSDLRVDAVLVATDANCKGDERRSEFQGLGENIDLVLAIPDPHIERWLLLDSNAFKKVLGKGCAAPDIKCARDKYKKWLIQSVFDAGITPQLRGLEHAQKIVSAMDLDRVASKDKSFRNFRRELRALFQGWRR